MSFDGSFGWNVRASTFVPIGNGSIGPQVAGGGGPRSPWVQEWSSRGLWWNVPCHVPSPEQLEEQFQQLQKRQWAQLKQTAAAAAASAVAAAAAAAAAPAAATEKQELYRIVEPGCKLQ